MDDNWSTATPAADVDDPAKVGIELEEADAGGVSPGDEFGVDDVAGRRPAMPFQFWTFDRTDRWIRRRRFGSDRRY